MKTINWKTAIIGVVVFVATAIQPALLGAGALPTIDWRTILLSVIYMLAVWLTKHITNG